MATITKRQLKLLKCLYRKPRTVAWIKKKFKVSDFREIGSGMFTLISSIDGRYPDDCLISINQRGIIEIESRQWFNGQFVLTALVLPVIVGVSSSAITALVLALFT